MKTTKISDVGEFGLIERLKKTVKKLIEAIPQDRILWQQDVKDLVQEVEEQMERHDVRD